MSAVPGLGAQAPSAQFRRSRPAPARPRPCGAPPALAERARRMHPPGRDFDLGIPPRVGRRDRHQPGPCMLIRESPLLLSWAGLLRRELIHLVQLSGQPNPSVVPARGQREGDAPGDADSWGIAGGGWWTSRPPHRIRFLPRHPLELLPSVIASTYETPLPLITRHIVRFVEIKS